MAFPETLLQARGSGMGCFRPGIARERCGSRPRQRRTPARPAAHIHARLCRAGGPQLAGKGPVSRFIPALELDRSLRGEAGGVGRKLIQTVPCQAGLACRSVHAATTAGDAPWHQSGGQPHRPTRVRKSVRLVPHSAGRVPLSLLSDKMLQHSGRSSGAVTPPCSVAVQTVVPFLRTAGKRQQNTAGGVRRHALCGAAAPCRRCGPSPHRFCVG